jgi:hypothetical protein
MKFSIGDYTADRVIEPSAAIVTRLIINPAASAALLAPL